MALTLTMFARQKFYVANRPVKVLSIVSENHIKVQTDDQIIHDVVDDKMSEVYPDVRVSVGGNVEGNAVRVAIEAPRDMIILTAKNYKRSQNGGSNSGV